MSAYGAVRKTGELRTHDELEQAQQIGEMNEFLVKAIQTKY